MHLQAVADYCPMQECTTITVKMDMDNMHNAGTSYHDDQSHCNLCFMIVSDYSFVSYDMVPIYNNQYFAYIFSYIHPLTTPPPII